MTKLYFHTVRLPATRMKLLVYAEEMANSALHKEWLYYEDPKLTEWIFSFSKSLNGQAQHTAYELGWVFKNTAELEAFSSMRSALTQLAEKHSRNLTLSDYLSTPEWSAFTAAAQRLSFILGPPEPWARYLDRVEYASLLEPTYRIEMIETLQKLIHADGTNGTIENRFFYSTASEFFLLYSGTENGGASVLGVFLKTRYEAILTDTLVAALEELERVNGKNYEYEADYYRIKPEWPAVMAAAKQLRDILGPPEPWSKYASAPNPSFKNNALKILSRFWNKCVSRTS